MNPAPAFRKLRVFPDGEALARALAQRIIADLKEDLTGQDRVAICLSGGRTPRRLYEILGTVHGDALPWDRVHFFWGDERFVPPDDPASNARLAREAWLSRVAVPAANLHPIPTGGRDPARAAWAYERVLRAFFGDRPRWNVLLLGLGTDGHTASLFPRSPALREHRRWVVAVDREPGPPRITLTYPALNAARRIYFVVVGAEKRVALAQLLGSRSDPETCPACGVVPDHGICEVWADRLAARDVEPTRSR